MSKLFHKFMNSEAVFPTLLAIYATWIIAAGCSLLVSFLWGGDPVGFVSFCSL